MGIPYSMRRLYKASLLTESQAFLKSVESWCTDVVYSQFFSSIWLKQNIWSVDDLLRLNPHGWFPIILPIFLNNRQVMKAYESIGLLVWPFFAAVFTWHCEIRRIFLMNLHVPYYISIRVSLALRLLSYFTFIQLVWQ
jgi:hypothetical protein